MRPDLKPTKYNKGFTELLSFICFLSQHDVFLQIHHY